MIKLREECCKKEYNLFVDFIDEHRAEMEIVMEQAFRNEQDFDDFLAERDEIVVAKATPDIIAKATPDIVAKATPDIIAKATPDIVAKATPEIVAKAAPEIKKQTVIDLYTKGLLSAEAAAKELDMTVPAFLDLVKAKTSV